MRLRDAMRTLAASGSGRVGLALLAVLVGVSVYVVLTFPLDFGLRSWNNPAVWADNPASKPPAWVNLLPGADRPAHRTLDAPHALTAAEPTARFTTRFRADAPPSFLSVTLRDVRFANDPPVVSARLRRPDGIVVPLLDHVPPGRRAGEPGPVTRYADTPFRLLLSAHEDALVAAQDLLASGPSRGARVPIAALQGRLEQVLFGQITGDGLQRFAPLRGDYVIEVDAVLHDARDAVGGVRIVVGGGAYGAMGTDSQGRDLAKGLLFGFPVALVIGVTAALLVTAIGTFFGVLSGYGGGATDTVIQRVSDILNNVPLLPILIFLVFILGQKLWLVILVLAAFSWPGLTITTRAMVLQLRTGQLVEATRALGASRWRIMFRHILLQIGPFVIAQMVFLTPGAILAEAGLSFLGLGDPSIPTWGQILESGFRTGAIYVGYWWWVLPPGLLVALAAMTFALLALGLEPMLSPRLRRTA